MNIIARKRFAITLGFIFFILLLVCILWLCIVITDFVRYKTENTPVFAFNVSIEDTDTGYKETYTGIGYKYVEYVEKDKESIREFYIFGLKI